MDRKKIGNEYIFFNEHDTTDFYKRIKEKDYSVMKTFKDDFRSLVQLVRINGKRYVLKVPKEKNNRKWQRFLSIFRGGESTRECKNLENIILNGFNAPKPYTSIEERRYGMVFNSMSIIEYVECRAASNKELDIVCNTLKEIHSKGFLHGDSQMTNFLISDNNKVYLIDSKFMKNKYGKFGKMYEFIYLEESCLIDLKDYIDKKSFYYKTAKLLNSYLHWWGDFRKKFKNKG